MLTEAGFIKLASCLPDVFIKRITAIGPMQRRKPNEIANIRNQVQRALAAYSKKHSNNGIPEAVQLQAMQNLSVLDMRLGKYFTRHQCKYKHKKDTDGSILKRCQRHGSVDFCRKAFEDWLTSQNY